MPHKIEISDKTYDKLKEFCVLNDLKIGPYADKLIFDGLMIEMYGDVPFTNYKKKIVQEFPPAKFEQEYLAQPEPLTKEEAEKIKAIDKEIKERLIEEMEKVEAANPPTCIAHPELQNEINKEILKQVGVPSKVVNKINKRRLK